MAIDSASKLVAAHPALLRGVANEVPDGWCAIVDQLCTELEQLLGDNLGLFRVHQIKSKFASLRFYYSLDVPEPPGEPLPAKVCEHAGGFNVKTQSRHPLCQAIDEAIAMAGLASEKTCETCGDAGEQMVDGFYVYVACQRHVTPGSITAAEHLAARKQRQ